MPTYVIPDPDGQKRLPNEQVIPVNSTHEQDPKYQFTSLTDHFSPRDQYTKPLMTVATHDNNLLNEHIQRLVKLIEARGKYVYLVKRILDGDKCDCYNTMTRTLMRHECIKCYGTRIKGGYQLYKSTLRDDGKIIIANPSTDDGIMWQDYGRDVQEKNVYWTLPFIPLAQTTSSTVFSYDFFVEYNENGTELGRFYIQNVKPSRSVDNKITHQFFTANRADPPTFNSDGTLSTSGDLIYRIDLTKLEVFTGNVQYNPDTLTEV